MNIMVDADSGTWSLVPSLHNHALQVTTRNAVGNLILTEYKG
jgi:hypothetical protein